MKTNLDTSDLLFTIVLAAIVVMVISFGLLSFGFDYHNDSLVLAGMVGVVASIISVVVTMIAADIVTERTRKNNNRK